jgi:hypothetical protein
MLIGDWPGMVGYPFFDPHGAARPQAQVRLILNFASDYIAELGSTFEVQ